MSHNGHLIQKIRRSKGITQKELANGIMSKNFLSKFERSECDITVEKFLSLLEKLNINFMEFKQIGLPYTYSQENFLHQYEDALMKEDSYLLEELLKKEKNEWKKDGNIRHKHNQILIRNVINDLSNLPVDREGMSKIKNYLLTIDDWGLYEISLFGNAVRFLSVKRSDQLVHVVTRKIRLFKDSHSYIRLLCQVLLNVLYVDIIQEEWQEATNVIELLEELITEKHLLYEQLKLRFYKGIVCMHIQDKHRGLLQCHQAIHYLYEFGEANLAHELHLFLENYQ